MKVIVYVEGESDKLAMGTVFREIVAEKEKLGREITFVGLTPKRNNKAFLVKRIPIRAADAIAADSDMTIVAVPDLYPFDCGIDHTTADELIDSMKARFIEAVRTKPGYAPDMEQRFHVFCFKHDMEALLLAAKEHLLARLQPCRPASWETWTEPVEDQDNDMPPAHVVKRLFRECGKFYSKTLDAPVILDDVPVRMLAERCPQQFGPFVRFIESI